MPTPEKLQWAVKLGCYPAQLLVRANTKERAIQQAVIILEEFPGMPGKWFQPEAYRVEVKEQK